VTALAHPDTYAPMVCYPRYADTGRSATSGNSYAVLPAPNDRKTLLAGITVNASPVAAIPAPGVDQQACIDYCNGQIATLLDSLFMHPNLPPMVARQLIQRLTTSNPSPGYIDRVAMVFEDDGSGTCAATSAQWSRRSCSIPRPALRYLPLPSARCASPCCA
jgi:uncharacterized protein (DUF1800 family)